MIAYEMIETKPEVMRGKPVIKGTGIPVDLIVRKFGEGTFLEDVLDGYPNLSREAIPAALMDAADMIYKNQ